jgi:DNA-binding NarL/FixJ family response regulator
MIRLAIAEEHALVRWAFRRALSQVKDVEVVGEAGTVSDTLDLILAVKPDVLLLDMTLPGYSGRGVLEQIRELENGPLVVALAPHDEPLYGARAIGAGAHGYVSRSAEPEQLIEAIWKVSRGETVASPDVEALRAHDPVGALTRRELQVMELIARGVTNREIAEHLQIAQKTVDTHRGHVLKKLGLRNNADLARFAVRHGYVSE